ARRLAAAGLGWYLRLYAWRWAGRAAGLLLLAVPILAGCTAARWGDDAWLSYHVLTATWALAAAAAFAWGCVRDRARPSAEGWAIAAGVLLFALAMRGWGDPTGPWWPAGGLAAAAALAVGLGLRRRSEGFLFAAAVAVGLAVSVVIWRSGPDLQTEAGWAAL